MPGNMRVRDVMSAPVVTAGPGSTVRDLARLMVEANVGSVVITDEHGAVAGIVTETDLEVTDEPVADTTFKWPRFLGRHVWSEESLEEIVRGVRTREARSIMTTSVATVSPDDALWEATQAMVENDVHHLPVVEDGRLVGMISKHDLLKILLAGDGP